MEFYYLKQWIQIVEILCQNNTCMQTKYMVNTEFKKNLTAIRLAAWLSLKNIGFLENHKAENSELLVKDLLQKYLNLKPYSKIKKLL